MSGSEENKDISAFDEDRLFGGSDDVCFLWQLVIFYACPTQFYKQVQIQKFGYCSILPTTPTAVKTIMPNLVGQNVQN